MWFGAADRRVCLVCVCTRTQRDPPSPLSNAHQCVFGGAQAAAAPRRPLAPPRRPASLPSLSPRPFLEEQPAAAHGGQGATLHTGFPSSAAPPPLATFPSSSSFCVRACARRLPAAAPSLKGAGVPAHPEEGRRRGGGARAARRCEIGRGRLLASLSPISLPLRNSCGAAVARPFDSSLACGVWWCCVF